MIRPFLADEMETFRVWVQYVLLFSNEEMRTNRKLRTANERIIVRVCLGKGERQYMVVVEGVGGVLLL